MLKAIYETQEEIPSQYVDLFELRGGKWALVKIEGLSTEANVLRLQTALTAEKQTRKDLEAKLNLLGDRSVEEILADLDRIPILEAKIKGGTGEDEVNAIVEARVKVATAQFSRQLANVEKERDTFKQQNEELTSSAKQAKIEKAIIDAAKKAGVREINIDDAVLYCSRVLDVLDDGSIVTKDNAGVVPGLDPLTLLQDMRGKRGWWDADASGQLKPGDPARGGVNPWKKDTWNLTQQSEILKRDRPLAVRMAAAAGIKLDQIPQS